jgi:hypothetical protein
VTARTWSSITRCKHENADHLTAGEASTWGDGPLDGYIAIVEQFRCVDCGAWLSLGRSKDADPVVRVELRAAAVAIEVKERRHGWPARLNHPEEVIGWDRHSCGDDPVFNSENQGLPLRGWTVKRWSGWLAREIAAHVDDPRPRSA